MDLRAVPSWVWGLIIVLAVVVAPIKLRILRRLLAPKAPPADDEE